jgi:regulator of G-protein signaling
VSPGRFWEAVQELKALPQKDVAQRVAEIWAEYLAPDASCPINVDSHSHEITKRNMAQPDRWTFDTAAVSMVVFDIVSVSVINSSN